MHKICCSVRLNCLITGFSLILVSRRLESFLTNARHARIAPARNQSVAAIKEPVLTIKHVEAPPLVCPHCGQRALVLIRIIHRPKAPPIWDSS